ncbi:MAG: S24/S26 family peptidase [Rhodospirillaceae bacterium]
MRMVLGFGMLRIQGQSMAPTLQPGDYVILKRYGWLRHPRPEDVIVYAQGGPSVERGQLRVKRITDIRSNGEIVVRGDGVLSAPTGDLGPVAPDRVQGRVIHVIRAKSAS